MSVILGAAATCLVSAFLPWISAELVVIGAAVMVPKQLLVPLVLMASVGQITGKVSLYAIARWAPQRLPERARRLIERASRLGRLRSAMTTTVLLGALFGVPPFYLVTLACGTLRMPLRLFTLAGLTGTLIRYAALAFGAAVVGTEVL